MVGWIARGFPQQVLVLLIVVNKPMTHEYYNYIHTPPPHTTQTLVTSHDADSTSGYHKSAINPKKSPIFLDQMNVFHWVNQLNQET
jgi:hypothetical protein